MRATIILAGLCLYAATAACLLLAPSAFAQLPPQLQIGQMEIKAYAPIGKTKIAVQLTQDTALGRELRGKVMARIAKRGNEVGFSGGNVLRMDVAYFDLLGTGGGGGSAANTPSSSQPGDNQRPALLGNITGLRGSGDAPAPRPPTLRLNFTLYAVDTGKVVWVAAASCSTTSGMVVKAGDAMINSIFDSADKSLVGDAGCPL